MLRANAASQGLRAKHIPRSPRRDARQIIPLRAQDEERWRWLKHSADLTICSEADDLRRCFLDFPAFLLTMWMRGLTTLHHVGRNVSSAPVDIERVGRRDAGASRDLNEKSSPP